MNDVTVLEEFNVTNFDLLRLINGGDRVGTLFGIRTIRVSEYRRDKGIPVISLKLQIFTNGIHKPLERRDVLIKKESQPKQKPLKQEKLIVIDSSKEQVLF